MIDIAKQENIGRIPTGAGPNRIALTPDGKTLVYQNLFCAPIGSSAIALTPAGKTLVYSMQTGESVGVRRHRFPQANRGSEAAGTAVVVHPHVCD